VQARLEHAHAGISDTLARLHTFFAADSDEVQREWARFTAKVRSGAEGVGAQGGARWRLLCAQLHGRARRNYGRSDRGSTPGRGRWASTGGRPARRLSSPLFRCELGRPRAQTDRRMEDALRSAVRRSLAELARLLAGDKRAEVAPLFTVALALERTNRIELRPTVQARPARRRRQ